MDFTGRLVNIGEITLDEVIKDLDDNPIIGAITTFTGITRELSDASNKKVVKIEVEAWEEKGDTILTQIAEEIGQRNNLVGLRIIHLVGEIEIGKPIVYVVIASIHRKEAFIALEEVINAYKQKSPVWKKEIYDDGTGNWISTAH